MRGRTSTLLPLLWLVVVVFTTAGCRVPVNHRPDADADGGVDGDTDGDADADAGDLDADDGGDADGGSVELALTGVQPNHGPFTGGSAVVLRGRGFVEDLTVRFGAHQVDPADVTLIDDNRINVLTPAGTPGSVDVSVAPAGGDEVILREGYTYDGWYLDPNSGSAGGGTLLRLLGLDADFSPESVVTFDGVEVTDLTWVNGNEMTLRTPPGSVGPADVAIDDGGRTSILYEGYSYYDSADPRNGGLGGGPIDGTLDVTVLDGMTRVPLLDAFVILGTDADAPFQGRTDEAGRITFSNPSLRGRQMLTASHAPIEVFDGDGEYIGDIVYESTTIVAFDARSVTILLEPIPPPQPGPPPAGRQGGFIEGELLFEHRGEFGPYEWDIVPEPADDEVKVAYVYTTQASVRSSRIEPSADGVVFNTDEYVGINGYRFRIYAIPGTVAVYSFAGLGRLSNPADPTSIIEFVPYVMGLTRGIVVGPEETVRGVQVLMTRQMSQTLEVELENAPLADESGAPNTYIVEAFLDLGAEGVISRPETELRSANPYVPFDFPGWVELTGSLSGSSYTVVAGAWTTRGGSDQEQNPWSVVYRAGITAIEEPIVVDEFLAVPRARTPQPGGVMEDNHMAWDAEGGTTPDFSIAMLSQPSGIMPIPLWLVVLRGGETAYDLPDLAALTEDLSENPRGDVNWEVWSFSVEEGFEFDDWSYRYLSSRYWNAYAVDSWYIRLRE